MKPKTRVAVKLTRRGALMPAMLAFAQAIA